MASEKEELKAIGQRMQFLREACDVTAEEMAEDRYPGYHYDDLAWRIRDKIMQPLEVTLDPSDEPAKLVNHGGQEFNLVLEGTVIVTIEDEEFALTAGDSIYFNPRLMHGQRCGSDIPARFVTVIAE